MEEVIGHVLDEGRALGLLPNRDDNKFSEVKVRRCANEFWGGSQRRGKVLHDASDRGMSEGLKFLVVEDGTDGFRRGLSDEKMGPDFNESGKLVYVRGSQLWDGGENGESGLGVEPVHGEDGLNERVDSGIGVEGESWLMVGTSFMIDEGRKVLEIKGDLYGVGAISCDERCALEVSAGNFNVM